MVLRLAKVIDALDTAARDGRLGPPTLLDHDRMVARKLLQRCLAGLPVAPELVQDLEEEAEGRGLLAQLA